MKRILFNSFTGLNPITCTSNKKSTGRFFSKLLLTFLLLLMLPIDMSAQCPLSYSCTHTNGDLDLTFSFDAGNNAAHDNEVACNFIVRTGGQLDGSEVLCSGGSLTINGITYNYDSRTSGGSGPIVVSYTSTGGPHGPGDCPVSDYEIAEAAGCADTSEDDCLSIIFKDELTGNNCSSSNSYFSMTLEDIGGCGPYSLVSSGNSTLVFGTSSFTTGTYTTATIKAGTYIFIFTDADGDETTFIYNHSTRTVDKCPLEDPELFINKTITSGDPYSAGGTLNYQFDVTTDVDLTDVTVSDPILVGGFATPVTVISPPYNDGDINMDMVLQTTETWIFTGSYMIQPIDVTNESVTNSAFAQGLDGGIDVFSDTDEATATLLPCSPPTLTADITNVTCHGESDGSITVNASGGSGSFTYSLDGGSTTQASNVFSGLAAGNYTVTVIVDGDPNCTASTAQLTITQPAIAVSVSGVATNATCFGESDGSIAVTNSAGSTVVITNAADEVVSATGLPAGVYTLTATADGGNTGDECEATATVTITQPAIAVSVSGVATNATCFGESDGSIAVTNSAGSTVVITNAADEVVSATGLPAGVYTLTATADGGNTGDECEATATVTITQPAIAVSVSGVATNATCFGESDGSIAVTNSAGSTVVITNAADEVVSATGLPAGVYTLTATADGGNTGDECEATATVTITQPAIAVSVSGVATNATCFGESDGSIAVTNSAGSTVVITNAADEVVSATGLPAGVYTLTATADGGNTGDECEATATVTITQPAIAVSVSGVATNATCFGESDGSIAVTNSAGSTVVITNAADEVVSATGLPAGVYTLTATADGGNTGDECEATATVTITQPAIAVSVSGVATNATCFGESDGSIAVTNSAGSTVVITNAADEVVSATGLPAGVYTLTATADGGNTGDECEATATVTITQPAIAVSVSGVATNATCFGESDGSIAVTNSAGSTVVITNAADEVVSATGLPAGVYTLTATADGGNTGDECEATATVTITQPAIAVSVSGVATNATCFGESDGSIAVTNSAGSTVVITNAADEVVSATGLPAGVYTLTATADGGNTGDECEATATVTITQPAIAVSVSGVATNATCFGESDGSIAVTNSAGSTVVITNAADEVVSATGLPAGVYTLTATADGGNTGDECEATATVTITQPAIAVSVSGVATNATCFGESDGSIAVTNSAGSTVVITNAADEVVSATGLPAGVYTLTATADGGNTGDECEATATVTITQPAIAVSVSGVATNATCFGESDGSIAVTNSAGSTVVITNAADEVVSATGLPAGVYTLTATADGGNTGDECEATATVTITQPAIAVSVSGVATNATCFGESDGSIAVTNSAGSTVVITNAADEVVSATGLPAGVYTLTATADGGNTGDECEATATVTITQPAIAVSVSGVATNATCFGESDGSIAVTNSAGSTVVITNAADEVVSATGLPAGVYTLTATADGGNTGDECEATATVTITQPAIAVSVSGVATNATCFGESDGSIAVTNSAGSTVVITNAADEVVSATGLPAGVYTLTATADGGNTGDECEATATVTITQPAIAVSVSGVATNATCFGESDGSIAVTNSAGSTVVITNAADEVVSATGLPAGVYTLTATADGGNTGDECEATATVTITQPAIAVSVSGVATNATCFGESDGSIAVTNSAGSTVVITNAADEVVSATGLPAGVYTLTATADGGNTGDECEATATVTITQPAIAVSVSGVATNATCFGESDGSIAVTNSAGSTVVITNAADEVVSATGLPAGVYTLTATADGGNTGDECEATATVTITQPAIAVSVSGVATNATCFGESDGSIAVTNSAGSTVVITNAADEVVSATGLPAGVYTLTATADGGNTGDECEATATVTITQPAIAVSVSGVATNATCFGESDGSIAVTNSAGSTVVITNAADEVVSATGLPAGVYTLTATADGGNTGDECEATATVTITQPAIAVSVSGVATNATCFGESDGSIAVTNSAGSTVVITNAADEVVSATGLPAGVYTLTATADGGNTGDECEATATVTITQPAIAVSVSGVATNATCFGESDGSIAVTNSAGSTVVITNAADEVVSATGLPAGVYTLTATADGGNTGDECEATATVTITQPAIAVSVSGVATNATCFGESDGSIAVTNSAGSTVVITNAADEVVSATGLPAGVYTLTATADGGNTGDECEATATVTITQPAIAVSVSGVATNATCFGESDGSIAVTNSAGSTVVITNAADEVVSATGLPAGVYTLTATADGGNTGDECEATATVTITQPAIAVSVSGVATNATCFGESDGSIAVTNSAGSTVVITNAADEVVSATGLPAGVYTLTATADGGNTGDECEATATVTITQPAIAVSVSGVATNATCFGESDGSIAVTNSAGSTVVITNAADEVVSATGLPAGVYTLTATADGGNTGDECEATATVTITEPDAALAIDRVIEHISCFGGSDGSVDITVSGGTAPYTFVWTGPDGFTATTEDISDLRQVDAYEVTVTDANGCTKSLIAWISQPDRALTIDRVIEHISCFGGSDGSVDITVSGGTGPYTFVWTGPDGFTATTEDISDLRQVDAYEVTVTDANGCTKSLITWISQPDRALTIDRVIEHISCFGGSDGSVDITVSGGTGPYTFVWTGPDGFTATTEDISDLRQVDAYEVTVTDANGCTKSLIAWISQPDRALTIDSAIENISCFGGSDGSVDITVSGGTGPYTFVWTGPDGFTATTEDISDLRQVDAYEVTVTDANGCTKSLIAWISQPDGAVAINIKVLLTGPYNSNNGLMNDDLRSNGDLPTSCPYDGVSCDPSVFNTTGNNAIVDWVWVELRDKNDNTNILAGKSALIQRDGDVVSTDGVSPISFDVNPDDYYVAIAHRIHLGIITAHSLTFSCGTLNLDLTQDTSLIDGGQSSVADINNGYFGLYAADFDGNGQIQNSDLNGMLPLLGISSYSFADSDMNGQVQNSDINILLPNLGLGSQLNRISDDNETRIKIIAPRR